MYFSIIHCIHTYLLFNIKGVVASKHIHDIATDSSRINASLLQMGVLVDLKIYSCVWVTCKSES